MLKKPASILRNLFSKYPLRRQLILMMIVVFTVLGGMLFLSISKLIQTTIFHEAQFVGIAPMASAKLQGNEMHKKPNPVISLDIESMESAALLGLETKLQKTIGITLFITLVLGLGLSFWLSSFITTPIDKLSKSITAGMIVKNETLAATMPSQELSNLHSAITLSLDRFEKQFESQNQFLLDVAHEFRTPVASLRMNVDVAKKKKNISSIDFLSLCSNVDHSTVRLEQLIDSLKSLSTDENVIIPSNVNIGELVADTFKMLSPFAKEKSIEIENKIDPNQILFTEPLYFQTIINNIIENSILYNKPFGSVVVSSYKLDEGYVITVVDNGIGMDDDELGKVFNRFYRVDKSRSRQTGGSGLGLSIVKELIKKLGGQIMIKSTLNSGTEVEFFIPHYKEPVDTNK